jgi:hypothetical protein
VERAKKRKELPINILPKKGQKQEKNMKNLTLMEISHL